MRTENALPAERVAFLKRLQNGIFSHAYLVEGDKGCGKRDFALFCAQALLCTGADKPCGVCPSCKKLQSGNHPDLHLYGEGEKAISVADVRTLIRETSLVPSDGDVSVYILQNAQKMLPPAQNALLKIFEEPPAGVVIFLLTDSRRALLPTIRSRGQLICISQPPREKLYAVLRAKHPTESEQALQSAVRFSKGSPGEAEAFFGKEAVANRARAREWLDAVFSGDKYRTLAVLTGGKPKREGILTQLDVFLQMLFDLLLYKTGASPVLLSEAEAEEKSSVTTRRALSDMVEETVRCRERIESNGNLTADLTLLATKLWSASCGNRKQNRT